MKPYLPALLILLLGAAFYLNPVVVVHAPPVPQTRAAAPLPQAASVKPVLPLAGRGGRATEPTQELAARFEAELKNRQPQMLKELRRGDAELEVAKWQGALDWSAEQAVAVKRLAMPKFIALAEARHRAGLTVEAYQAGVAAARAELEAAMLQALGAEGGEAWQRAFARSRERAAEDKVNSSMRAIEEVITLEAGQKDRLYEALMHRATDEPTGPVDDSFVLKVSHDAGILPPLRDERSLAKDILTPEQMQQFDLAQEAQQAMTQTVRDFFQRLMGDFSMSTGR